nr:hypothetical protein [Elusimicrobiales bacterium]
MRIHTIIVLAVALLPSLCCAAELKTAVHIHTTFSRGGKQTPEQVVARAADKGLDAVIITDTLTTSFQYGLRPFENVAAVSLSQASILKRGPRAYLRELNRLRKQFPGMVIIPGTEAAAYYRWEGDPFKKLVMWDWNRHMLVFGLEKPSDYSRMPSAGNPGSGRWAWQLLLAGALLLLAFWHFYRRLGRSGRILAGVLCALALFLLYPFKTPRWSIYSSATPWEPYRALADYAHSKGALAFWAHPEAPNWNPPQHFKGPLYVAADKYPEGLKLVPETDGFSVFMEGYKQGLEPGEYWDRAIQAYIAGERPVAPWALAELDYVSPGYLGTDIDTAYMLVSAQDRSPTAVLQGLRKGAFQSVMGSDMGAMKFTRWQLRGAQQTAEAGGQTTAAGELSLSVAVEK